MPIRASEKHGGKVTAVCVNCDDEIMTLANARFTLQADESFGEVEEDGGYVKIFIATCNACGYVELYRDGFLFKSDQGDA